ncbi:MAG: phosphopantothenoylcysteine decarboxylase [Clostridiales Family XIII bacterium]|jgi:phosphopantothenoylcysteine decarboxylase/phosphopantothenoylcysteine decarboxylase/phosphopantothenate--cysteine ligase|nr:phosphopantothenoylcysteine decarboxylase [Clostridiales Family XIII bacterium]
MNILLGVTGSIAAYKACEIASKLVKAGHTIDCIMTKSAQEFITPLSLQTITKNKVVTDMFRRLEVAEVEHISLAQKADIVLIAPATGNIIAKLAQGVADDMLTTVVLAAYKKRRIFAPAMNTDMYENPITQRNIAILKDQGWEMIEPIKKVLACGDYGNGALADVEDILSIIEICS